MTNAATFHPRVGTQLTFVQSSVPSPEKQLMPQGAAPIPSCAMKPHTEYSAMKSRELNKFILSGEVGNWCQCLCHEEHTREAVPGAEQARLFLPLAFLETSKDLVNNFGKNCLSLVSGCVNSGPLTYIIIFIRFD